MKADATIILASLKYFLSFLESNSRIIISMENKADPAKRKLLSIDIISPAKEHDEQNEDFIKVRTPFTTENKKSTIGIINLFPKGTPYFFSI
jgi:hypothetical protein